MGLILLPGQTRYIQPLGAAPINWSNPITRGLVYAAVPGIPLNLVDGVSTSQVSTTAIALAARSKGLLVTDGAYGYPAPASSTSLGAQFDINVLTAFILAQQNVETNSSVSFLRGNGSGAPTWGVGLHGGSNKGPYVMLGSYSYAPTADFGTPLVPRAVAITGDGATATVYYEGKLITSGAYTPATNQYDPANQRQVFFGAKNQNNSASATFPFVGLLWNRPLSPAEIASISANPWQVFKSPQRVMKTSGGLQAYTFTPSGGFTLSGTGTALRSTTRMPAGGLTFSGAAASSRGVVKTASGGIALAGTAPQTRGATRTASGGISFGGAATVLRGLVKTPVGGMVFAGTAAIVRTCTRLTSGGIALGGAASVAFQRVGAVVGGWINTARRRRRE